MKGRWLTGAVSCAVIILTVAGMAAAAGVTTAPDARFVKLVKEKPAVAGERAWLGIRMQDVNKDMAEAMDLKVQEGALVSDVESGSPADEAGMKNGDVIVKFDGKKVGDSAELTKLVRALKPGRSVPVTVLRDGAEKKLTVKLGNLADREQADVESGSSGDNQNRNVWIWRGQGDPQRRAMRMFRSMNAAHAFLGVELQGLNDQLGEFFGVKDGKGALIASVVEDSPAAEAGLKAGDVITKIGDTDVTDPSDVTDHLSDMEPGDTVNVTYVSDRGRSENTVTVKLAKPPANENMWYMNPDMNMGRMPDMQRRMQHMQQLHNVPEPPDMPDMPEAPSPPGAPENKQMQMQMQDLRNQMDRLRDQLQNLRDELQKQQQEEQESNR